MLTQHPDAHGDQFTLKRAATATFLERKACAYRPAVFAPRRGISLILILAEILMRTVCGFGAPPIDMGTTSAVE